MTSISLTIWIRLSSGMTRIILGGKPGRETHGPIYALARNAKLPLNGPPSPCEHCERILPYAQLWRSLTMPSRAYCAACLAEAVRR